MSGRQKSNAEHPGGERGEARQAAPDVEAKVARARLTRSGSTSGTAPGLTGRSFSIMSRCAAVRSAPSAIRV